MINFVAGFLAGLSTGVYCLSACLPIFIPLIIGSKHNIKNSFVCILEFSIGRLVGYLLFGIFIGFLGNIINVDFINKLVGGATIFTGLLLTAYSLGLLRWEKKCQLWFKKIKIPFILGFLTGINICPPFIASLTYVLTLKNIISSVLYFLAFFLGTSIYIIPAGFLGIFSKDNLLQKIARFSGIFVGVYFVWRGIITLVISY